MVKCESCEEHQSQWTLKSNYNNKVKYNVCSNCLLGLVAHSITKKQFKNLIENGHSKNEFLLHGDFYDNFGNAEQPIFPIKNRKN